MKLTLGSLFDGIGGWLLAARHAGVTPIWASEIEPFPCSVTAQHHLQEKAGALNCMHNQQIVLTETTVRRLTPTECERLQGLPDGYTAGGSDAARYKAIGNGMAQPCADYVIRRIVDEIQGGNDG